MYVRLLRGLQGEDECFARRDTGSLLILFAAISLIVAALGFALLIYRVVLQVLGIMAVHHLEGGQAAIVIIVPTVMILIISVFSGFLLVFASGLLHM